MTDLLLASAEHQIWLEKWNLPKWRYSRAKGVWRKHFRFFSQIKLHIALDFCIVTFAQLALNWIVIIILTDGRYLTSLRNRFRGLNCDHIFKFRCWIVDIDPRCPLLGDCRSPVPWWWRQLWSIQFFFWNRLKIFSLGINHWNQTFWLKTINYCY